MGSTEEVLKAELIAHVVQEIRSRVGEEEASPAGAFARQFYGPVAAADLQDRGTAELVGAALSLWQLARVRQPGKVAARVYNPTLEEDGWDSTATVIQLVNDDRPFLVDSVTAEVSNRGHEINLVVHPVVRLRRDDEGRLLGFADTGSDGGAHTESMIYLEIDRIADAAGLAALKDSLLDVLAHVRLAVADWQAMLRRLDEVIHEYQTVPQPVSEEELAESIEFLNWLKDDHFTFLGFREYRLTQRPEGEALEALPGTGLGILSDELREGPHEPRKLTPAMSRFARQPELIFITKTNGRSPVHRPAHMDYLGLKRFAADGELVGEYRFQGLFTSLAYRRLASKVPLLRRKALQVLARAGFSPHSHDARTLAHIVETFPRDELFQISAEELYETAMGILQLQERRHLALFVRQDSFDRFIHAMVFVPRDRYNTALRLRMEKILSDAFEANLGAAYAQVGEEPLARLQFYLQTEPGKVPKYDTRQIEAALADAARTWGDRLAAHLRESLGGDRGIALARRYGEAFSVAYQEAFEPEEAAADAELVEEALGSGKLAITLYRPLGLPPQRVHFKVFTSVEVVRLSAVVPLFENLGFRVDSERPFVVEPRGNGTSKVYVHDFELAAADEQAVDLARVREPLQEAFLKIWSGEVENDSFNRLVLVDGLAWRDVVVLRAYCRYLWQTNIEYSQSYMAQTFSRHSGFGRWLVDLFKARFDPEIDEASRGERSASLETTLASELEKVTNPNEDAVLRRFFDVVKNTLRTNFYQTAGDGGPKPYLSFKLDSRQLLGLPKPRPMFEIWVYSPRVEGVHLRGGMVARGGIRWSDRPEDFRTEILGLMKAQMVKNAVIVPVGAKGGFIVKQPPADRQALQEEGVACYKTLVRGLLDLTDNFVGAAVVPPPRVVRHDSDDPYLVVAADKGTATFSDIANGISAEYNHWLGDAFASGGSAGYDHKAMAITSRGAWVSVMRHFREMGRDTQNEPFTCVGVGDMSGDVFGNGMLRSRHMRLLAAFNHLHIFVDPNPDPEVSFDERQRLFDLPRSSWKDYDPSKISAGGGVFERQARHIPVSPEMRQALAIKGESITPNDLILAILRADVDLIWFGGIGTYVKASDQSHEQVRDRANEAVRVDATEIKAKVIGEGANLALTQAGRIEYALRGGRINTDAIDNSGGVDCSDHEVNIKILFSAITGAGDLTLKQRDELLEQMTEEVGELVLRDNYLQTQAITVAESQGVGGLFRHARLIRDLERAGRLDRALEGLPDDEAIAERQAANRGLTRPEIAVLLAYSKIYLYDQLLASTLPDDPILEEDLTLYFPVALRERFPQTLQEHRLRREIIATHVTNSMVNRVGPTFVLRISSSTGASAPEIARAYIVARDAFDLRSEWAAIEALDYQVPAAVQTAMIHATKELLERATLWLLRHRDLDLSEALATFRPGIGELAGRLQDLLPASDLSDLRRRQRGYEKQGVPAELAARIAGLELLASALDIVALARRDDWPIEEVARVFYMAGNRFGFDWLREQAEAFSAETPWQRLAKTSLIQEVFDLQSQLTGKVLAGAEPGKGAKAVIDHWADRHEGLVARTRSLLADLKAADKVDVAVLSVARHQLGELAQA